MKKYLFPLFCVILTLFCISQQLGVESIFCQTSGCELYKGMSILGISFYGYGTMLGIACLVLFYLKKHVVLSLLMTISIISDVCLLAYQSFFWPCVNCLFVGSCIYFMYIYRPSDNKTKKEALIKTFWIVFFCIASFGAMKEIIKPVPVYGTSDSAIKVFFSPSCESCKDVIDNIIKNNLQEDVALYPVNKNFEDIAKIDTLMCSLRCGESLTTALNKCFDGVEKKNEFTTYDLIKNRAILLSNKMYLSKIGSNTVPVIWNNRLSDAGSDVKTVGNTNATQDLGNIFGSKQTSGCSLNAVVEECE